MGGAPLGEELVLCVDGLLTLHQESPDGAVTSITLTPHQAVVNAAGVWHTADVPDGGAATALFITAGEGTTHRPR